ncbi:MAG: hypothetical protein EOO59_18940 [Hymenobacter sp.]|nr:MAG: hypothetical protein EOO59_18940 [Hymenobacter sp.]
MHLCQGLLLLAGWLLAIPAWALASSTPSDTLPGRVRLARHLSAAVCTQLASYPRAALATMPLSVADSLLTSQFGRVFAADSVAYQNLLVYATALGVSPLEVGALLGEDLLLGLRQQCPAARPLLVRLPAFSSLPAAPRPAPAPLPIAEVRVLKPVANRLGDKLVAVNKQRAFTALTAAQRQQQFAVLFSQELAASHAWLRRYYSAPALADEQQHELGNKIGRLLLAEPAYRPFILQLAADALRPLTGPRP